MFLLIFVALVSLVSLLVFVISLILLVIDFFKKKSIVKYAIILPSVFILFIASGFTSAYISNHIDKNETSKSSQNDYKVYDLNVSHITTTDLSDWKITGTTSAPDGSKLFATYGDETDDDYYGINAASSSDIESWATVRNGKFTMMVNPLTLRYEEKYKGGTNFKAYLFAVTGLKGKLSKYSDDPKISDNLKSAIAKKIKTTSLTLTDSQADYYNSLDSDSSDSSKDSDAESSESSSEETSNSEEDTNPQHYQTGITYDQVARTPDDYKDKKIQFTGKVVQVMEDDDDTQIRLAVDGNSDNIILIDIANDDLKGSRILEDDLVTASGISAGTTSYDSTMAGKITIPSMKAVIINNQGKASDDYGE